MLPINTLLDITSSDNFARTQRKRTLVDELVDDVEAEIVSRSQTTHAVFDVTPQTVAQVWYVSNKNTFSRRFPGVRVSGYLQYA